MSSNSKTVFPYIPNSVPEVKAQMLREVGAHDVMDLYAEIPERLRFKGKMNLPEPIFDEYSLKRHVEALLDKNKNCKEYLNFLGAGCAEHFVPRFAMKSTDVVSSSLPMLVNPTPTTESGKPSLSTAASWASYSIWMSSAAHYTTAHKLPPPQFAWPRASIHAEKS